MCAPTVPVCNKRTKLVFFRKSAKRLTHKNVVSILKQRFCAPYFLPKSQEMMPPPILRSMPERVVGMPVLRAMFWRRRVMPKARFHENDSPGMGVDLFDMMYVRLR